MDGSDSSREEEEADFQLPEAWGDEIVEDLHAEENVNFAGLYS